MKILYKQTETMYFQINNCFLKYIVMNRDSKSITKKVHHHTDFEIHVIEKGLQIYEMDSCQYTINPQVFLIIPPQVKHRLIYSEPNTQKYSITFNSSTEDVPLPYREAVYDCRAHLPDRIWDNLDFIKEEVILGRETSILMIKNRLLETIVLLFRAAGLLEQPAENASSSTDSRITLAKQYIADNVELDLSADDVAKYCYLSPKHLSRLFLKHEECSLYNYIKTKRVEYIAALLRDGSLSLKEISERMHFSNEYYFNTFVRKNLGQPPGAYRKMYK